MSGAHGCIIRARDNIANATHIIPVDQIDRMGGLHDNCCASAASETTWFGPVLTGISRRAIAPMVREKACMPAVRVHAIDATCRVAGLELRAPATDVGFTVPVPELLTSKPAA
jgi:hypothetical protein